MNCITSLPDTLKPQDLQEILRISRPVAYRLIKKAEEEGLFTVIRIGNMPRMPKESFMQWYCETQKPTGSINMDKLTSLFAGKSPEEIQAIFVSMTTAELKDLLG